MNRWKIDLNFVPSLWEVLSLDLRSLACARILLGLFVFGDLVSRAAFTFEHYSMLAFWPLVTAVDELGGVSMSLAFASGDTGK
jgi:hypothetical protein